MTDIFENSKFGDRFITKNGFVAIFLGWARTTVSGDDVYYFTLQTKDDPMDTRWQNNVEYRCDGEYFEHMNNPDGRWNIVSKYQEPCDESRLDDFAEKYCSDAICSYSKDEAIGQAELYFKAGYRKAKEN